MIKMNARYKTAAVLKGAGYMLIYLTYIQLPLRYSQVIVLGIYTEELFYKLNYKRHFFYDNLLCFRYASRLTFRPNHPVYYIFDS